MRDTRSEQRVLAVSLAFLAGLVDALGFLSSGGLFVSFMSGNSTRLGVGIVDPVHGSLLAGVLIGAFVIGVTGGALVARKAGARRKPAVLVTTLALLVTGAVLHGAGAPFPATLAMAAAMGALNAVFQRDGEVSIGVTYMTGTLVKLGQNLATALTGGPRWGWLPYLLLWAGLMAGAIAGAVVWPLAGPAAPWAAVAVNAAVLGFVLARPGLARA